MNPGISAALTANLNELSRQHNVTLFMLLLAAFQLLLHRYTGQKDIVVASPSPGARASRQSRSSAF